MCKNQRGGSILLMTFSTSVFGRKFLPEFAKSLKPFQSGQIRSSNDNMFPMAKQLQTTKANTNCQKIRTFHISKIFLVTIIT